MTCSHPAIAESVLLHVGLAGRVQPLLVASASALPCPALPCPALPCPALPCPALPCPALPCPALPCPALPCPALPCPALPCPALPCPALPCNVVVQRLSIHCHCRMMRCMVYGVQLSAIAHFTMLAKIYYSPLPVVPGPVSLCPASHCPALPGVAPPAVSCSSQYSNRVMWHSSHHPPRWPHDIMH